MALPGAAGAAAYAVVATDPRESDPTPLAPAEAAKGWDLGAEVERGLAQAIRLGQVLATVAIWLLFVGLPLAALVLVGAGVSLLVYRRVNPRRVSG